MSVEVGTTEPVKEEFKDSVKADLHEDLKQELKPELKAELKEELVHHENWHAAHVSKFTFKDRAADNLAKWMGSWTFIFVLLGIIAFWTIGNVVFIQWIRFDPFPFILLNLFFSFQATIATPIILMSQNRAAERDKAQAEHQNKHLEHEVRRNTELTQIIHDLTKEIHRRGDIPGGLADLIREVEKARADSAKGRRGTRTWDNVLSYLNCLHASTKDEPDVEHS